ncbi:MAG: tail fiber domain-containing protein [Armatimonadetes bacterium]|nr:tail fiber domain-containing protein [Armatimonadota bacterium]
MSYRKCFVFVVVSLVLVAACTASAQGVPRVLDYQGRLTNSSGVPLPDGSYQVQFKLFPVETGGTPLWIETKIVQVAGGLFATTLGYDVPLEASIFDGSLYLEIVVEGTTLSPRRQMVSSPFALRAGTVDDGAITTAKIADNSISGAKLADDSITSTKIADGTITGADIAVGAVGQTNLANGAVTDAKVSNVGWSKLINVPVGFADGVDNDTTYSAGMGLSLTGTTFSLNTGYTNGMYWGLTGNNGTNPTSNFLGTADYQPLELRVYSARAMRFEPTTSVDAPNVIGGYFANNATYGAYGATIAGGGSNLVANRVTDSYGAVGGGMGNIAGNDSGTTSDATYATVGGGNQNQAGGIYSTVGGGRLNSARGSESTVAGGYNCSATQLRASVGGGSSNQASNSYAAVAGGMDNIARGYASFVAGGSGNVANTDYSAVGGGAANVASGRYSAVPGGFWNAAQGEFSLAAGRRAKANHSGSFVWADSVDADLASTANNQFLIRASGGVGVGVNDPVGALDVNGIIRSRLGGFRFPDGTTQTTAATFPPPAWSLTGNSGTIPSVDFIGTTDNQALELRVNGLRALRLEPNATSPSVIEGWYGNSVTPGVYGGTVGGGGTVDYTNRVTDLYGTVSGGRNNQAGDAAGTTSDRPWAAVGGGESNLANGWGSTVGGGEYNTASGGGYGNDATGDSATVAGGYNNSASFDYATIGGGKDNVAGGSYSTVPGGEGNSAAHAWTLAAGRRAKANHQGSFVWADSTDADFTSTNNNQFLIRASSGVGIGAANPQAGGLSVNGGMNIDHSDTNNGTLNPGIVFGAPWSGEGIASKRTATGNQFGIDFYTNYTPRMRIRNDGVVTIGDFYVLGPRLLVDGHAEAQGNMYAFDFIRTSDGRYKKDIQPIPDALETVTKLQGVTYDWRAEEFPERNFPEGRHIGFIGQEVEKVLPEAVSKDNKGFRSVSYDSIIPVLVEAIKEQQREIDELKKLVETIIANKEAN